MVRDISLTYFWECSLAHWNLIRHFEKREAAFGDALVYERKFKSVYLERPIYELLLKSESSIVKLIENKSDLSKLSTFSESSVVKFIENQCEHLSKLTLYHLKKRATRRSRRAREPRRISLLFLREDHQQEEYHVRKKFVFKKISTIEIPKSSKLHRYVNIRWENFILHDINVITNAIQR